MCKHIISSSVRDTGSVYGSGGRIWINTHDTSTQHALTHFSPGSKTRKVTHLVEQRVNIELRIQLLQRDVGHVGLQRLRGSKLHHNQCTSKLVLQALTSCKEILPPYGEDINIVGIKAQEQEGD